MCNKFEGNRSTRTVRFFGVKKKNTKKIKTILRMNISRTDSVIPFKFGMRGGVYIEHVPLIFLGHTTVCLDIC